MNWTRRGFLKTALALPAGSWLANYRALAAPYAKMVKITALKTLQLDNVGDGCLIRVETDSGLVGYGESTPSWRATASRRSSRHSSGRIHSPLSATFTG
jgi:L-alanine-DL-glutamate epimerase-like enolase superfamily enzyme